MSYPLSYNSTYENEKLRISSDNQVMYIQSNKLTPDDTAFEPSTCSASPDRSDSPSGPSQSNLVKPSQTKSNHLPPATMRHPTKSGQIPPTFQLAHARPELSRAILNLLEAAMLDTFCTNP